MRRAHLLSLVLSTLLLTVTLGTVGLDTTTLSRNRQETPQASRVDREVVTSSIHMKELALKLCGPKVVAHMLHRFVQQSSTRHSKQAQFGSETGTPKDSPKWAGYVAYTGEKEFFVNGASGEFTVPNLPSGGNEIAPWIGIGGFQGDTHILQTGVAVGTGDRAYQQAWYQLYPNPPVFLYDVNPGDTMFASVALDSDTGAWDVLIEDSTTNQYFDDEFNFNPNQNSAEWIIEVPNNTIIPEFDTVSFTNATWIDQQNETQTLTSQKADLYQDSLNRPEAGSACASDIGADQQSFYMNSPCHSM